MPIYDVWINEKYMVLLLWFLVEAIGVTPAVR